MAGRKSILVHWYGVHSTSLDTFGVVNPVAHWSSYDNFGITDAYSVEWGLIPWELIRKKMKLRLGLDLFVIWKLPWRFTTCTFPYRCIFPPCTVRYGLPSTKLENIEEWLDFELTVLNHAYLDECRSASCGWGVLFFQHGLLWLLIQALALATNKTLYKDHNVWRCMK